MDNKEKLIFLIISHTRNLVKYIVQAYTKRRNSVYKWLICLYFFKIYTC